MEGFIELFDRVKGSMILLRTSTIQSVIPNKKDRATVRVDNGETYEVCESYNEIKRMLMRCEALEDDLK